MVLWLFNGSVLLGNAVLELDPDPAVPMLVGGGAAVTALGTGC